MRPARWYRQDISRSLTSALVLAMLCLTALFVQREGMRGILDAAIYFGGIAFLVGLYVTMRRQWPRLFRYLLMLWRRSY